MPYRSSYGVSFGEVEEFVRVNHCVAGWLKKYASDVDDLSGSRLNKARILCRFFKWLRVKKDIDLDPKELLNRQGQLRQSVDVEDRQWLLRLVLDYSRDNPDFASYSDMRKYDMFTAVKSFCEAYEVALTTAKGVYGKKKKKKNHRKQINLAEAKSLLGSMSQRDRTVNLIQLQSGMGIGEVLNKFNYMWFSQVKPQLDEECSRMKICFDERKANGTWYFTFVSYDAIHELRKWLQERQRIIEKLVASGKTIDNQVVEGEPIFITNRGTPLTVMEFARQFNKKYNGKVTTHMFRKLFESEAKVPDRAIDRGSIKFFMGHIQDLDDVGGTYDRNPEIRAEIFEKEYAKLEPFINIYSGQIVSVSEESEGLRRELAEVKRRLNAIEDPELLEALRLLKQIKQK